MSQVQNNTLHNFLQPALFLGAAFLAGRIIEQFPGASKGGLLLSATLGSGLTLFSQKFSTENKTPWRKLPPENESSWHSLARVTISLALGTILASYASKTLKGRADITMPAALRFGLIEVVLATGLAIISPLTPYAQLLNKYYQYRNHLYHWRYQEEYRITDLAKKFYEANLPPISLKNTNINHEAFDTYRNFSDMTAYQLGWHVEMFIHSVDYSNENLFALNFALHAKGFPMNWDKGISKEQAYYAQNNHEYVDLLHDYFTENPIAFARITKKHEDLVFFKTLFDGKDEFPALSEHLQNSIDIQELCIKDLSFIIGRHSSNEQRYAINTALNIALDSHFLPQNWDGGISLEEVYYAQKKPECVTLLRDYFTKNPNLVIDRFAGGRLV